MKKTLKLCTAGLLTLALTACGSGSAATTSSEAASTADSGSNASSGETASLVVYQNKAEVTAPMQEYADAWGAENNATVTVKTCTGTCDYGQGMKSDINAGEAPDIFIIEGDSGYNTYKDMMATMDDMAWVDETEYEYIQDGHVYGLPVAIEGYGLAYNKDILDKAGVDPESLTTISAYRDAFAKIDSMKDELGIKAVVSLTTTDGNYWIMGNHDIAGYLSSGLDYYDTSVVDAANKGEVDADRMATYADWVELLYQYSDQTLLTAGANDEVVAEFGAGHYAFMHQGTWADQPVSEAGGDFTMGFAPYATLGDTECTGLFAGAPSWYCLNKDSKNLDLAKKYLEDLVDTDAGQKMMVEGVGLISAFTNNSYKPSLGLSVALSDWIEAGKTTYSFTNQYKLPDGFTMNTLGPIYAQFATGGIDKAGFIQMMTDAIGTLAN